MAQDKICVIRSIPFFMISFSRGIICNYLLWIILHNSTEGYIFGEGWGEVGGTRIWVCSFSLLLVYKKAERLLMRVFTNEKFVN